MKKLQSLLAASLLALSMSASALEVGTANCTMLVSHFDVSAGWFTGLVVQSLTTASNNNITIKTYTNDVLSAGGNDLTGLESASTDVTLTPAEKRVWALDVSNQTSNPAILETGIPTGWLFVLSDEPVTGFILFGRGAGDSSLAGIGPVQSIIGGSCDF